MLLLSPQLLSYRGFQSMMAVPNDMAQGASDCCSRFACLPSFLGGIVVLALVEFVLLLYVIARLLKRKPSPSRIPAMEVESQGVSISFSLQGDVWVAPLPEGDWSKAVVKPPAKEKKKEKDGQKEGSKRGESASNALEIAPMWRHAILKDNVLFLKAADGTEEQISLAGCEVLSVSSGSGPNSKWGKKFPIKLHHPDCALYRGCKDCLLYLETGYEKEAWCEVLRAAARMGSPSNDWFLNIKREFRDYTLGAEAHTPYLNKFHTTREANHFDVNQKEEKPDDQKSSDEGLSKKRLIWKKLMRRGSKGKDSKETRSSNALDELGNFTRRIGLLSQGQQDEGSVKGKESAITNEHKDGNNASNARTASYASAANDARNLTFGSSGTLAQSDAAATDSEEDKLAVVVTKKDNKELSELPAAEENSAEHEKERPGKEIDQGLLCLNMIIARLYFDFYHSATRVAYVQRLFQRLLSRIRTPSYIKSITIKELDLGREPPFATAMRMLPADAGGALALEIDLEWYGGGFITCETRLDVRDQNAQEKVASQLAEPGLAGAAAAAILSGIEEDLETAGTASVSSTVMEARQAGGSNSSRSGDEGSRKGGWVNSVKSMMSRVADQVSQVPLLLKIRLVSLKGTAVLRLRAPPSDRIWFAFKEMPEIDLVPEPCIGDHRISSGPLGAFIANQLKVQLQESLVMPYCEDLFVNWMMGEKDDWLPQSTVPIPFSALQTAETERQNSKPNNDAQPKPSDETPKTGWSPLSPSESTPNRQENPHTQASESHPQSTTLSGPVKPQTVPTPPSHAPNGQPGPPKKAPPPAHTQSTLREPTKPHEAQPPVSHSQSSLQAPGTNNAQPGRSSSSAHLTSQFSFPTRPPGAVGPSSTTPSIREDTESDLTRPLLEDDGYSRGQAVGSNRESDAGASNRAVEATYVHFLQSEGSASESDLHFLANQESTKDADQGSRISRRAKMLSLGKKMGTKLDERRRTVLERLRDRKADGTEGSAHSQASG